MWIDPLGLNPFNRITGQTVQRATDLSILLPGMQGWKDALTALQKERKKERKTEGRKEGGLIYERILL